MKKRHKIEPVTTGPLWGLIFGVFVAEVGICLWFYGETLDDSGQVDEFLAVTAAIVGVILVVYACREILHQRKG